MTVNLDMARMVSATTGSGDLITLDDTVEGFVSFQAELQRALDNLEIDDIDNAEVFVAVEQASSNPAMLREVGRWRYNESPPTLTRLEVYQSTNSGIKIALEGAAQFFSAPLKESLASATGVFYTLEVLDWATIEGHAAIGSAGAVNANRVLHVSENFTGLFTAGKTGLTSDVSFQQSGAGVFDLIGINGVAGLISGPAGTLAGCLNYSYTDAGSTGDIVDFWGLWAENDNYGSGDVLDQVGGYFLAYQDPSASGLTTDLIGVRAWASPGNAPGTLTNAYGGIFGILGAGAVNAYGLYVLDTTGRGSSFAYNIYSGGTRGGGAPALASTAGGNLFVNHCAIGNYADVDKTVFAPGDAPNTATASFPTILNIVDYLSGDLSGTSASGITIYPGYRHTGAGVVSIYSIDMESTINSDSTGDLSDFNALYFGPVNYGSGDISFMSGVFAAPSHQGAGTVAYLAGMYTIPKATAGSVTNLYGALLDTPVTGATITNAYGLYIADHSGIGSSRSYNLFSGGPSFITPASVAGGNLLVGHTAIGNYADVDHWQDSPGDPGASAAIAHKNILTINEFIHDDFSGGIDAINLTVNAKNTVDGGYWYGLDENIYISSDNTKDFNQFLGLSFFMFNFGSGDIDQMCGFAGSANHAGAGHVTTLNGGTATASVSAGTCDAMAGLSTDAVCSGGSILNMFGVFTSIGGGGAVTNAYGLYIDDASGIGSALSLNMLSAGANSLNVFEGEVEASSMTLDGGVDAFDVMEGGVAIPAMANLQSALHAGAGGL